MGSESRERKGPATTFKGVPPEWGQIPTAHYSLP
jgi:hypothetical protein